MKAPRAQPPRLGLAAAGAVLAGLAALSLWRPALAPRPGLVPARPPGIRFVPDAPAGDAFRAAAARSAVHSPAAIALSAAPLWPPVRRQETESVEPPLDLVQAPLPLAAPDPMPPLDLGPMLRPPRPVVPPRTPAAAPPHRSAPPPFRLSVTGGLAPRDLVLEPLFALEEPSQPWSFSACLALDDAGLVRHVLIESADLPPATRAALVRALYACRRRAPGAAHTVRLAADGPGRDRRDP